MICIRIGIIVYIEEFILLFVHIVNKGGCSQTAKAEKAYCQSAFRSPLWSSGASKRPESDKRQPKIRGNIVRSLQSKHMETEMSRQANQSSLRRLVSAEYQTTFLESYFLCTGRPPERQGFLKGIAADGFRRSHTAGYFVNGT